MYESVSSSTADLVAANALHYDRVYSSADMGRITCYVEQFASFLADAACVDTSWYGLYQRNFAGQIRGKRILELGCGDGLNALIMAKLGANVVANDISLNSAKIIEEVASRLDITNITTACGDFLQQDFPSHTFDMVVGKAFVHHLSEELEEIFLQRIVDLIRPDGEVRWFEPAVNSQVLDWVRWAIPVPGRPSSLSRKAFAAWKIRDPHPDRDNSSAHYERIGKRYFEEVEVVPMGSLERFSRLMPRRRFQREFRRWAHRADECLPMPFRRWAARSQLVIYRKPRM